MAAISKQLTLLTQGGRLKPDVRLGVAVSEFAQSLDDGRKREFQKMQTAGTQLCGRDAVRVTEELNQDSARRHQSWRPCGTKCGKFLDRLQTLANIGDVMIGGSQNMIATSVWCAVRLALQTATNFRGYFERLSSLFMKLGTAWELHHEFAQIFPQSQDLQTFLCEYLIVLMRLCGKAVVFSKKSLGGQLWSSLGATFESEFKPLQEEMDKWGLMIQHKTQQLATTYVVDAEMFRRRDYKQRMLHLLSPNQSQHVATWRRHRRKGDCKWVFQTEAYTSWIANDTSSTLRVTGKLGSGKTVTMANLVAQTNLRQTCSFFFCAFKEKESLKATTVLGSIAFHLLDSIPGDNSAWGVLSRDQNTSTRVLTSDGIIRVLTDLLPDNKDYVVVVDGLEYCPDEEIAEVISGLCRLMEDRKVLLCYSARSGSMFDALATKSLDQRFSVSLEDKMHDEEIQAYITEEIARRRRESHLGLFNDRLVELVKQQLLAGSQGMYLWVALQLDTIFPSQPKVIVTYEEIMNLISDLPKDLPEAFERALEGTVDNRYGNSIMKIVMAAQTPLTLDELKVALTVIPGDTIWYAAKVPTNATQLVALCGGNLLELDEEDGKVRFIHYSVVSHLLQTTNNPRTMMYHFTSQEAEIHCGAICVTFLNMPIFGSAVTLTRNIEGDRLAEKVIGAASREQPFLARLAYHLKKQDHDQSTSTEFDIGRLLAEIQATTIPKFDPHCFQVYAVSNWLSHSRSFNSQDPVCVRVWGLWMKLLCGRVEAAKPPFTNPAEQSCSALSWALINHHRPLVHAIFNVPTTRPREGEKIARVVLELPRSPSDPFDNSSLGLVLLNLFQLTASTMLRDHRTLAHSSVLPGPSSSVFQALHQILRWGADLSIFHTENGVAVLKMLFAVLGRVRVLSATNTDFCDVLDRILRPEDMRPLLRSPWVPYALREILKHGNTSAFTRLLSYDPMVRLPPEEISVIGVAVAQNNMSLVRTLLDILPDGGDCLAPGGPAMSVALARGDRMMLELLANHGGLNNSDSRARHSGRLLGSALGCMDAKWIKILLTCGADPIIGYSIMVEQHRQRLMRFGQHIKPGRDQLMMFLTLLRLAHPHLEMRNRPQTTAEENQTVNFSTPVPHSLDASVPLLHRISDGLMSHTYRPSISRLSHPLPPYPKAPATWIHGDPLAATVFLDACKALAEDLDADKILERLGVIQPHDGSMDQRRQGLWLTLMKLAEATPPSQLNVQCPEGNTALHYLTGGMADFDLEAFRVAFYLLDNEPTQSWQTVRNKHDQSPLRRAIERASQNSWGLPYTFSILFLVSMARIFPAVVSNDELTGDEDSILGLAILKGANVDPIISSITHAGANLNATLKGATPLEIAVNMPSPEYAAQAVFCLLAHGADPSVKYSTGDSLLDNMDPIRLNWLHHTIGNFAKEPCLAENKGWNKGWEDCKYVLKDVQQIRVWKWLIIPD